MNAPGFLNSCNAFVDEGLLPLSRNLLAHLAHLAPDPIDVSLEVVDTPYVVAEVRPDPSGARRFAMSLSRGLLVRLYEARAITAQPPVRDLEVLRSFEHEADIFALEILLRTAAQRAHMGGPGVVDARDEAVLIMIAFLVTVHTWMALDETLDDDDRAHPEPVARLSALPLALIGLIDQAPGLAGPIEDALGRCRAILSHAVQRYPRFRPLEQVFAAESMQALDTTITWMKRMDVLTVSRRP